MSYLPNDDCGLAIYAFRASENIESRSRVILLIDWCPEDSDIKAKNLYAASKDALKNALQDVHIVIHATNLGDLRRDIVFDMIKRLQGQISQGSRTVHGLSTERIT